MATGTVAEAVAKSKDDEFASAVREFDVGVGEVRAGGLESGGGDGRHPALADGRLRAVAVEAMRAGLGEAWGGDGTATCGCGGAAARRGCCAASGRGWTRRWDGCLSRWRGTAAGRAVGAAVRGKASWTSGVR